MQYGREVAEARRKRDELIERATAEAREAIAKAAMERDAEIRRLHAEGFSSLAIAPLVGCPRGLVYELLHADRKARYDARRRNYARGLRAVA